MITYILSYHTCDIAFRFYERFPDDVAEAEAQAELFVTLLANEVIYKA